MHLELARFHDLLPLRVKVFADIADMVRDGTLGAVLVDGIAVDTLTPLFGVDRTEAVDGLALLFLDPLVFETEVGAGAEVAVEVFHLMALSADAPVFVLLLVQRSMFSKSK